MPPLPEIAENQPGDRLRTKFPLHRVSDANLQNPSRIRAGKVENQRFWPGSAQDGLTGAGSLVKAGTGSQELGGASPNFTGPTTVAGGTLLIAADQVLPNSTVTLAGGGLSFVSTVNPALGALGGTGNVSLAGLTSLTVGGNNASATFGGNLSGSVSAGLFKIGTGTWSVSGANTQSGPFNIQAGTVRIGSTGALPATAPVTVSAGATLDLNGYNYAVSAANPLTIQGNLRLGGAGVSVASGATATYNGAFMSNGFLRGSGTQIVTSGATLSGITTFGSTTVSVTGPGSFQNFSNGGQVIVAGNLAGPTIFDGFTNQGSGSITVGAVSQVNASDFQSYGTLTLNPATVGSNQQTLMTNTGTSAMFFNGGSRTFIGTPQTATSGGQPTFVAGMDLEGKNLVVAGGLFVNNGFVSDYGSGPAGSIIVDYGALYKGAGFTGVNIVTQNGGRVQAGNSPGSASFGKFVFGPGGVSNYVFAIDDAKGEAGPSPDAIGHVSGWGLVKAVAQAGGVSYTGDFSWTATPSQPLTVSLDTLLNPTTVGTDVAGPMANFNPDSAYSWPAARWAGTYSGPTDVALLDAATNFDTSGFVNPIAGLFSWSLDSADQALSLTYTPSAVPEPGTLALTGLAAIGWVTFWRRRWTTESAAA